jgi:hypothetical protein
VFYEWLPSWWTESAVYEWLDTEGAWLVPWHLHLSAAFLEWAAFHRLIVTTPKHRKLWRQLRLGVFVLHGLAFFGTFFVLDGGYSFRAVSGIVAVAASVLAVVALTAARLHLRGRSEDQQDV